MHTISIDIETYSSVNLAKAGVYKYTESDDFELLLFAYSVDGGEVKVVDLAKGDSIPIEVLEALSDESITKWAFNVQFERICLSRYLRDKEKLQCKNTSDAIYLRPRGWKCSMVWAATLGLPLSLEGVGAVLGLDKQKLSEGKSLISYFCVPCKATKANEGRTRNKYFHDVSKWELFKAYNKRDVEVELGIQRKLSRFPVSDAMWEEFYLDQEINDRGIVIDPVFVQSAIAIDERVKNDIMHRMTAITKLDNPNSVIQLKEWLATRGVVMESLGKKEVAKQLETSSDEVKEALLLRQQLAKSSVKKYTAMIQVACKDNRARGMFRFYGANRTGRFAGRLVQLQNLPQNHLLDLAEARALVRQGNIEALIMLYEDIPSTLSQLIRTAFVPKKGHKFIVADFSAIEARVLANLADENWRIKVFKEGKDIYCMSASQMFGVPVEKHGVNGHLRQKGKVAELACIAEGQLVLTDYGLVPIERVEKNMKLWDGKSWVSHDGVICKGEGEVITYEGLTATTDHLVWAQGKEEPIQFGKAATRGLHLLQTGDGRREIRMGSNHQPRKTMEQKQESLLCVNEVCKLWKYTMAKQGCFNQWKKQRLSALFSATKNTIVVKQVIKCSKTTMPKSQRQRLFQLWRKRHSIQFFERIRGRFIFDRNIWLTKSLYGNRQDKQRGSLRKRQYSLRQSLGQQSKQTKYGLDRIRTEVLVLFKKCSHSFTYQRSITRGNYTKVKDIGKQKMQTLEVNRGKVRLYDIRNAGPHHRFTVSNRLVHNCGYGGSVSALKAMGAIEMGLEERELSSLVTAWRESNPNIVSLWWDMDRAIKTCITKRTDIETHGIRCSYQSGFLFIQLPSGRKLVYVKPRLGINAFGGESVTYEEIGATKKWERMESYGPKFVENIVQGISRDILIYAMQSLRHYDIVAHVHDELIIEVDERVTLDSICNIMGKTPSWAKGLLLRADGYECEFYKKD